MKSLKITLLAVLSGLSSLTFAQTKIIAHKSHSGNHFTASDEADNFGDYPGMHDVIVWDSVIRISDTLFVKVWHKVSPFSSFTLDGQGKVCTRPDSIPESRERTSENFHDTVRRYFPEEYDFRSFKASFSPKTVYIGFDHFAGFRAVQQPAENKNYLWIMYLIIGGSGLTYLFRPLVPVAGKNHSAGKN